MSYFTKSVHRITSIGGMISGICLLGVVFLLVANVISHLAGIAIIGSYEILQFTSVVVVAFAFGYTAAKKFHVMVRVVLDKLSRRTQAIFESCTSLIGIVMLVIMARAAGEVILERWFDEKTETLLLPYAPFRIIWILGLIIFCLVLISDLYESLKKVVRK